MPYTSQEIHLPVKFAVANEICRAKIDVQKNVTAQRLLIGAIRAVNAETFPKVNVPLSALELPEASTKFEAVRKACKILLKTHIEQLYLNNPKAKRTKGQNIFSSFDYTEGGQIEIEFIEKLRPLIIELQKFFAMVDWWDYTRLRSYYSEKLYLYILSIVSKGSDTIPLEDFLNLIVASPYMTTDFRLVKRDCLEQAKKELKTILPFQYRLHRKGLGGKVTAITFYAGEGLKRYRAETVKTAKQKGISALKLAQECHKAKAPGEACADFRPERVCKSCKLHLWPGHVKPMPSTLFDFVKS